VPHSSPTLGDVIRRFDAPLRQRLDKAMTSAQNAVLSALGRCRTAALGGHLYTCDHCGAEHPTYNGCNSRHCPSCLGHKSAQWLQARADELLPVPYFHVVFTVPEQVAALALGNKKLLYGMLFRAASQTLRRIAADPKHMGAAIGFLAILHTWTQTLLHHPHLHCVVPGGGLSSDGARWIPCRDNFFLPVKVLSSVFRGKFLALLDQAAQRGEIHFAGSTAVLADPVAWKAFLSQMRRKDWVVYAKPPFGSPEQVLKYLARYTHRVAISNRRIISVTNQHVSFRYRDRRRADAMRTMTLEGTEFLRRFLLHLLPKGFVRIRYYGILANPVRADNLVRCRALLGRPTPVPTSSLPLDPESVDTDLDAGLCDQPEARRCPNCSVGRLLWTRQIYPAPPTASPPPDTS
jgi:hypothetical protein